MTDIVFTFSATYFHENSFSWSFGVPFGESSQDLKFIETSHPDFSNFSLSVRNTVHFRKDTFVCQIKFYVESCYAHCKSFFIDSPFRKSVQKVVKTLKDVSTRGFRSAANAFLSSGCAPQARLATFIL